MDETYSKLVDTAYNLHVSGKLDEAKSIYEKLLTIKPDDVNVLNLYAQLNVSIKNYDFALNILNDVYQKTKLDDILLYIAKVYTAKNDYESAIKSLNSLSKHNLTSLRILALSYMKTGNNIEAIKTYEKIINDLSADFNDFFNLSVLCAESGNLDVALKYALSAYKLNGKDTDINLHLASIYDSLSMCQEAINHLLNIPEAVLNKDILYRIGILYKKMNDDLSAVKYLNKILDIDPDNKNALLCIASIYKNHDKNVSVEILTKLYEKNQNDTSILTYLYTIYESMMNYNECLRIALKLIELEPDNFINYSAAGDSYYQLFKYDDAVCMYKKARELNDNVYSAVQIAVIYSITGKITEAFDILSKYPDELPAQKAAMYIQLREKNLYKVKEEFYSYISKIASEEEIEKKAKSLFYKFQIDKKYSISEDFFNTFKDKKDNSFILKYIRYKEKAWKNYSGDIKGKRLLIYSGNGAGDLIMFCRYIAKVKSLFSEILLQVPNSFVDLFKINFPDLKVYSNNDNINEYSYDITTSFMELLYYLNIDLNKLDGTAYLQADENSVKEKSLLSIMHTGKKKIGLYWQGNPAILANRSIKLEKFLPVFDLKDIQVYSFQISKTDFASEELKNKLPIIDLSEYIKSYSDTAAFLKNIDILISIDTSIANLAGAIGIKTYLLLPFETDWRWFYDTKNTPWYNSVKIFKQTIPGGWEEVILRVKNELSI